MRKVVRISRKTAGVLILFYFVLLLYWMFIGFGRAHNVYFQQHMYNLTPFHTIKQYIFNSGSYNTRTWVINLFGNIGVFIPFGICIPYVFNWRAAKFMIAFITGIAVLELTQMLSRRGSFDIDDIILNTLGAFAGYLIFIILKNISGKPTDWNKVSRQA
ncbi:VanZ family protein [Paenibacillus tarimensis]